MMFNLMNKFNKVNKYLHRNKNLKKKLNKKKNNKKNLKRNQKVNRLKTLQVKELKKEKNYQDCVKLQLNALKNLKIHMLK